VHSDSFPTDPVDPEVFAATHSKLVIAHWVNQDALCRSLEANLDQINTAGMAIDAPFRMRRRGVELKLPLGEAPSEIARTRVRNIVKAKRWME
jgi:hypothetical protein